MASGEELLNQLINQSDPYRPATSLMSQFRYNPVAAGDKNIGTSAAVGLGQVLLTQMLNNESRDFRAGQRRELSSVLPALRNNPLGAQRPEGLNSDVFEAARAVNLENFLELAQEKLEFNRELAGESRKNRESMIAAAINNNPRAKYDPDWAMAQLDRMLGNSATSEPAARLTQEAPGNAGTPKDETTTREEFQLGDPDTDYYKAAQEERGILEGKDQALKYIDDKFDEAKGLVGMDALANSLSMGFIPTEKGQLLEGLGDSVVVQIDTTLGRELNSDVRTRLLGMTPKAYDSATTIDKKREQMKELVSSLIKPTPILNKHNASLNPNPTPTPEIDIKSKYTQLRNAGVSKEEAAKILGIE